MHVKEQVRDFVHDVKRKFSKKHRRGSTCSTCAADSHDGDSSYSSADTLSTIDDAAVSSSAASSLPPQRRRFISFRHPRTPSSPPKEHSVLHKVRRVGSKRFRLFSAPSTPSMRVVAADTPPSSHAQSLLTSTTEPTLNGFAWESRSLQVGTPILVSSQEDFPDVLDISPCSVSIGSGSSGVPKEDVFCHLHPYSVSESQTCVTPVTSRDFEKSASDSDSRFDVINLHPDEIAAPLVSSTHSMAQDPDVPPAPPPKADQVIVAAGDDEEITLAQSSTSSLAPVVPVVPQASRAIPPVQPTSPTPASPAPVYIPRLTAPSMFLPIPNTDPLSALLIKHVPAEQRPRRDVVGEYAARDIHEMVMSNSWRALARMARDIIVASDPEDLARILDFWSLRLSSLARLRLTNQASAECTNLFAVLNAVHPTSTPGAFSGSGTLPPSIPFPSSPAPAPSLSLSPSGLSALAQLPGTPSQKPTTFTGGSGDLVHPFELTVLHARVQYWSGDQLGYIDALSGILARCKEKARQEGRIVAQRRELGKSRGGTSQSEEPNRGEADEGDEDSTENVEVQDEDDEPDDVLVTAEANLSMWLERIARVCLILASQMIEMNDYQAAINLLAPLCTHRAAPAFLPTPSPELHSALARVYLLSGNLPKAEEHFSFAASAAATSVSGADMIAMDTALLAAASGDWTRAEEALGEMVVKHPENVTGINNLAVTLLCQGRIKEGIDLLEAALKTAPFSAVVAEPFLFNLSTLYELRSAAAIDKKRALLIKVAMWSGDGLRTSCLKMPSS